MISICKEECSGCSACMNICPKNCIDMVEDEYGFRYPSINEEICVNCHLCEKVCPIYIRKDNRCFNPTVFACQNSNDVIRKASSSGGIFSLLADYILENNGTVYGAEINDSLEVHHVRIIDKDQLYRIRGSKYIQSHINSSFKKIKHDLNKGKRVLFVGTGCQIDGLKSYLFKEYDYLITIEVVCHGVPSEKVFRQYINENEKYFDSKVKSINFRDKVNGWNNYSVTLLFEDGKSVSQNVMQNDFMKGYIHNLYLRPSCKKCEYKNMSSGSDILLGDFWGVNELGEPWNDNQGTSVVFINTSKGRNIFEKIKSDLIIKEVDLGFSIRFNPCVIQPVEHSKDIYEDIEVLGLHEAITKNISQPKKETLYIKAKKRTIRLLKRCTNGK